MQLVLEFPMGPDYWKHGNEGTVNILGKLSKFDIFRKINQFIKLFPFKAHLMKIIVQHF